MSSSTSKGTSLGQDIKGAVKGIHGAGEAIRGTINEAVDTTFDDKAGQQENRAIAQQGVQDVKAEDQRIGAGHGVRTGGVTDGLSTTTTTGTAGGAHSGPVGGLHSEPASGGNLGGEPSGRSERF